MSVTTVCANCRIPINPGYCNRCRPSQLVAADLLELARLVALNTWPRGHRARITSLALWAIAKAEGRNVG